MRGETPKTIAVLCFGFALGAAIGIADAARNSSGTYSLPSSVNPVVAGTTITPTWANTTMSDVATELTASFERNGKGCMLAKAQMYVGTVSAPGLTFCSDTDTGLWHPAANSIAVSVGGASAMSWDAGGSHFPLPIATGVVVNQSTANERGLLVTGNGTGSGTRSVGGATSGYGGDFLGGAPNGGGVLATGDGTGYGVDAVGGDSNGTGVQGTGGATNGIGVNGQGTGNGVGVKGTGGPSAGADGVVGYAGSSTSTTGVVGLGITATNGQGVRGQGNGTGYGGFFFTTGTGYGLGCQGDTTSPVTAAFHIEPQDTQPTTCAAVGDIYVTTAGVLKICTAAGTPGTWASVGAQ